MTRAGGNLFSSVPTAMSLLRVEDNSRSVSLQIPAWPSIVCETFLS